jgi:hypothetical protein
LHHTADAQTDTDYYRHIVFDNSLTPDHYFYSWGQATGGGSIKEEEGRLPVETKTFLTPPNALRVEWESKPGGGWEAEIRVVNFRYRFPEFAGKNLYFWCFSQEPIAAAPTSSMWCLQIRILLDLIACHIVRPCSTAVRRNVNASSLPPLIARLQAGLYCLNL